jgi:hypothetical protein
MESLTTFQQHGRDYYRRMAIRLGGRFRIGEVESTARGPQPHFSGYIRIALRLPDAREENPVTPLRSPMARRGAIPSLVERPESSTRPVGPQLPHARIRSIRTA